MDKVLFEKLRHTQWLEPDELRERQQRAFMTLLRRATSQVPYYRRTIGRVKADVTPDELPLLTKEDVRQAGQDLVAEDVDSDALKVSTTGGTTGTPLALYRDPRDRIQEQVHVAVAWSRGGFVPGDKIAAVVARPVGGSDWKEAGTTLWLGGDRLDAERLNAHYQRLVAFRPTVVRGYPSALSNLAQHMLDRGLQLPACVAMIGTSSEVLYEHQRDLIKAAFSRPIINLYGQNEHVAMASSCDTSEGLHVSPEYGLLEIIDDAGYPVEKPGVVGEIVATGLGNEAAPLIRYRTGDRAAWAQGRCVCGRGQPQIEKIDGRTRERVQDVNGQEYLFGPRFYGDLWTPDSPIRQTQFVQPRPGVLQVCVVPTRTDENGKTAAWVAGRLQDLEGFIVDVVIVDEVQRTAAGKQPLLLIR